MAGPERQYWDSNVLITMLSGTDLERVTVIRELLELEARGRVRIVISTLVIAEVRPLPTTSSNDLSEAVRIREMFDSERFEVHAVTRSVAFLAAQIGFEYPELLPPDCIHLATAVQANADVFFTHDGAGKRRRPRHLLSYDRKVGTPPLRIAEPSVSLDLLFG
jgi:predicted nucleic acid-binding protein